MLITQKKFTKTKEVEQTISIKKPLLDKIDQYIVAAGIEHGVVRAGETKYTQEAKREFFILACIEKIIELDGDELERLKESTEEETVEEQSIDPATIAPILDNDFEDLLQALE